jgi:hypothetical protein
MNWIAMTIPTIILPKIATNPMALAVEISA